MNWLADNWVTVWAVVSVFLGRWPYRRLLAGYHRFVAKTWPASYENEEE